MDGSTGSILRLKTNGMGKRLTYQVESKQDGGVDCEYRGFRNPGTFRNGQHDVLNAAGCGLGWDFYLAQRVSQTTVAMSHTWTGPDTEVSHLLYH